MSRLRNHFLHRNNQVKIVIIIMGKIIMRKIRIWIKSKIRIIRWLIIKWIWNKYKGKHKAKEKLKGKDKDNKKIKWVMSISIKNNNLIFLIKLNKQKKLNKINSINKWMKNSFKKKLIHLMKTMICLNYRDLFRQTWTMENTKLKDKRDN